MLKLLIGTRSHGTQRSTVRCKIMHLNLGQGKGNLKIVIESSLNITIKHHVMLWSTISWYGRPDKFHFKTMFLPTT